MILFWLCDLGLLCEVVGWFTMFVAGLLVGLVVVLRFVSIDVVLIVLCITGLGGLRLYLLFSVFYVV